MKITTKKPTVPKAPPREPMTKKARAAIEAYALYWGAKEGHYTQVLIGRVLQAERMKRVNLYLFLQNKGYRWNPKQQIWRIK